MCHCLGEHRLACPRRAIEKDSARRINPDLPVELMVGERKLDSLTNLLLLYIAATYLL